MSSWISPASSSVLPLSSFSMRRMLSRYSASVCRPMQGAAQRWMWNSRQAANLPASMLAGCSGSVHVRSLKSAFTASRTAYMAFTSVYGPKYLAPSRRTVRVGKTRGKRSLVTTIHGYVLSSLRLTL